MAVIRGTDGILWGFRGGRKTSPGRMGSGFVKMMGELGFR